jgi:phosphoenolpyruvate carboxylase
LNCAEGFFEFWAAATPIDVLEQSFIGSRPARRGGAHSFADLRAIPWVFSWTQARFYLSGWYGLGTALERLSVNEPAAYSYLKKNAAAFPFLPYVLYNAETSISSSDLNVMEDYSSLCDNEEVRERIFSMIREEFEQTAGMLDDFFERSRDARRPRLVKTLALRAYGLARLHAHQVRLVREPRGRRVIPELAAIGKRDRERGAHDRLTRARFIVILRANDEITGEVTGSVPRARR